jgi:hypothetical protein
MEYISVTLPFLHIIPTGSVQHAEEDINGIPEFKISQSVAAKVTSRSEQRTTTLKTVLIFRRVMLRFDVPLAKGIVVSLLNAAAFCGASVAGVEIMFISLIRSLLKLANQ